MSVVLARLKQRVFIFPARFGVFLGAVVFLASCASYTDEVREMRSAFVSRNYDEAQKDFEKAGLLPEGKNRLLYFLERSMIFDRQGKFKESRKMLLEADRVIDELYTTSISKTAATYIYNESASDYEGEDYEKVAVHTMLAMSFLEEGDLKAATVQARKINNRLYEINQKLGDAPNKYATDAFALYLSGIIFEARGMWDDALIDYRKALEVYEGDYKKLFRVGVPEHLPKALEQLYIKRNRQEDLGKLRARYSYLGKGNDKKSVKERTQGDSMSGGESGELVVFHELGNIAYKVAIDFFIPLGGQMVRFSFPEIPEKSYNSRGKTGVELASFVRAEQVQDHNAIADKTLEDRRLRLVLKQGARLLVKGQLVYQAEKKGGPLAGLVANAVAAATETADTRSWNLLPGAFHVSRISLPAGEHEVKVYNEGRLSQIKKVTIKANSMVILRDK